MNAGSTAVSIAERIFEPEVVLSHVRPAAGASLSDGLAGTALLHARLAHLDPTFTRAAAAHWTKAAERARRASATGGIYYTFGGLAASLIIGSPYLPDPQTNKVATDHAVRWMSAYAIAVAEQHEAFLQAGGTGTPWHVYDVISGLAGVGRVLLAASDDGHSGAEPGLYAALRTLTNTLTEPQGNRPGWWTAPDQISSATGTGGPEPTGTATTGVAHGVAGPLALLARSVTAGYEVSDQKAAVRHAADWLCRWQTEGVWQAYVSGDDLDAGSVTHRPGRQTAWCYGIPGISRALLMAGDALSDPTLTATASTTLASLAHRPEIWDTEGPTLCHGHAGILQSAAGLDEEVASVAVSALAQYADPARPFAFAHRDHGQIHDNPGFLTGAAGVALALADHAGLPATPVRTPWDALLLVS